MQSLASHIDYTALKPGMTQGDALELCQLAGKHEFAAACLPPYFVSVATEVLAGSATKVCTVVGFPHGMHVMETKLAEADQLIQAGVEELDIVANLAAFRSGELAYWQEEIEAFAQLCRRARVTSKVIIESGLLSIAEVDIAADLCIKAQVDFVKTSTGFAQVGAELDKVRRLREILPPHMYIKASGGIRSREVALEYIAAGANRIGTSTLITD